MFVAYSEADFESGNILINESVIAEVEGLESGTVSISGYDGVYKFATAHDAWKFGEEYTIAAFYQQDGKRRNQYSMPKIAVERLVVPEPTSV